MAIDIGLVQSFSAAGAGTVTSAAQSARGAKGVKLYINISSLGGGLPTMTVSLQNFDSASGTWNTLLASTALAAAAMTTMTVYPGLLASANVIGSDFITDQWRLSSTVVAATGSITATIGAHLLY
jgi:hypothetical protein